MTFEELKAYAPKISKLTEFAPAVKFKQIFEEMAVHTRKRKPKELLLKQRPNEPKDVFDYRIDNYEPITYGSMNKAFDNLYRILNGVNAQIHIDDEKVKEYMNTKKFMRSTFDIFFSKLYVRRMIEDPNGFLVWLPNKPKSDGERVQPYPVLMFSYNIKDWGDDFIVFLSNEKSYINKTKTVVEKSGDVYYILTTDAFYKYTQIDGGKFALTLEYQHNIGEIPMVPLGGDYNSDGFYESFFAPYCAFGNEAIRRFSDLQALSTTSAHPIREVFVMPCEIERPKLKKGERMKVRSSSTKDKDENFSYSRTVEVRPFVTGPFNEIRREIADETGGATIPTPFLKAEIPSVRFISPPIEYVKNASEQTNSLLEKAEDTLHLNLGKGDLSGYAKELDQLSHEDMLNKIANQYFDAKQSSARFIIAYMKRESYETVKVKLTKPASFRVKTEAELMVELTTMKTANAPAMLVSAIACQLADLRFSGDDINKKIFKIVSTFDHLFVYSLQEKQSMVISGTARKDDVTQSIYIYSMLLAILEEKGQVYFLETSATDLFKAFQEKVKPFLIPETVLTDALGNAI